MKFFFLSECSGTTGDPMSCCEIKLVNWEEGNYQIKDVPNPRGEIHIGGPNVAVGYYKQPDKTNEEFYKENGKLWFRTGDIGEFTPEGRLKVYLINLKYWSTCHFFFSFLNKRL